VFVTAKIQKKDGSLENYDRTKLLLSIIRAQATPDQAEEVLSKIESWLIQSKEESVSTKEVHDKVVEVLKVLNPHAAQGYEIYRKSQGQSQEK
jgi:transcriptional regulator NrdR family protein